MLKRIKCSFLNNKLFKTLSILTILSVVTYYLGTLKFEVNADNKKFEKEKLEHDVHKLKTDIVDNNLYDSLSGKYYYSGHTIFAALKDVHKAFHNEFLNFEIAYKKPSNNVSGYDTGIKMLLNQQVDFIYSDRVPEKAEIEKAALQGLELEVVPILTDSVAFYVNYRNRIHIKSLSIKQIQDIYKGKINNWQQVGGPNMIITPISINLESDNGLSLVFGTNNILLSQNLSKNLILVDDHTAAVQKVSLIDGAISYSSSAIIKDQKSINPIAVAKNNDSPAISPFLADRKINLQAVKEKIYPLSREIYLITYTKKGNKDWQKNPGLTYANLILSTETKSMVEEAGLIPK